MVLFFPQEISALFFTKAEPFSISANSLQWFLLLPGLHDTYRLWVCDLGFCSDYIVPRENDEKSHCSFGLLFPSDKQYGEYLHTPVEGKVYSSALLIFQSIYWEWKEQGYRI